MTSGEYGAAYLEERLRVGDAHQRMNLAPQWYLGTYCLYIRLLLPRLVAEFASVPERLTAYLSSLTKVMFLDMGLAIDAYIVGGYMNRTLGDRYRDMADRARAALAALDAQERAKQTLVDMMVHDIRNPVSGILMSAQVILRLPFSKLAVERMGGTMWTDSCERPGTTVYFTLLKSHVSS